MFISFLPIVFSFTSSPLPLSLFPSSHSPLLGLQEWLRALQHCTTPPAVQDRQPEIQQARSLNLVVKDCKLAKPNSQVRERVRACVHAW